MQPQKCQKTETTMGKSVTSLEKLESTIEKIDIPRDRMKH